jgi:putative DNA primase/helicase
VNMETFLHDVLGDGPGWVFIGRGTEQYKTDTGKAAHGKWTERPFQWPDPFENIDAWVTETPDADWYFTPSLSENPIRKNQNKGKGRKRLPVWTLWSDLDDDYDADRLRHLVDGGAWLVNSGSAPGRQHLYIPLVEPADPDDAEDLLHRIAAWLGADPAPTRHGSYLRLVGTHNQKPAALGTGPAVEVTVATEPCEAQWTVDALDDLLPPAQRSAGAATEVPDDIPDDVDLPEWLKEVIDEPVAENMDRSEKSFAAVGACVRHGLTEAQIIAVMRRHAPTVDKYGARSDAEVMRSITKIRSAQDTIDGATLPVAWVDVHVGEAFADHLGDKWVYVTPWRKWMRWDGKRWAEDNTEAVHEEARRWIIDLGIAVMKQPGDNGEVLKKIATYKRASNLEAVVKVARRIKAVEPDVFDSHPHLLNVGNGVVDLRTAEITPHNLTLMLTKIAGADYLPDARHDDVTAVLASMTPAVADSVQQLAGTAASGQTGNDLVPVFDGTGANAKTTILTAMAAALGDYGTTVPAMLVMQSNRDEHPHLYETLRGVRLAYIEETEEDGGLRLERVKKITGGGDIDARPMGGSWYTFTPSHTLVIATNHRPIVNSAEYAMWRRLKLIPFPFRYTATPERPNDRPIDIGLRDRLRGRRQREAVLAWIVAGAVKAYANGNGETPVVKWCDEIIEATREWEAAEDVIGRFVAENIRFTQSGRCKGTELFSRWRDWCLDEGRPPGQAKNFHRKFAADRDVGERVETIKPKGSLWYIGIGLTPIIDIWSTDFHGSQQPCSEPLGGPGGAGPVASQETPSREPAGSAPPAPPCDADDEDEGARELEELLARFDTDEISKSLLGDTAGVVETTSMATLTTCPHCHRDLVDPDTGHCMRCPTTRASTPT